MTSPIDCEKPELEAIVEYFSNDLYATEATGCVLTEGWRGHAVAELMLTPQHCNAAGGIMGGAIFTLADYALAVACNVGEPPTVSVSNTIEFISAAKGDKLIATCDVDRSGGRLGFYTIDVRDDTGRLVAKMTATCARVAAERK